MLIGANESECVSQSTRAEVLKVLLLDTDNVERNTIAKEHCITYLINSLHARHFFLCNIYPESFELEINNSYHFKQSSVNARVFLAQYIARIFGEISR